MESSVDRTVITLQDASSQTVRSFPGGKVGVWGGLRNGPSGWRPVDYPGKGVGASSLT